MFALRIMVVVLVTGALAAPAFAKTQPSQKLQKTFQAVYNRMNQAFETKNLDRFMACYDPSYAGLDEDKKVSNFDQVRQGIQFMFGEDNDIHMTTSIVGFKPWKNGVLVLVQSVGKWVTDSGTLHMKVVETDEDYWVKSGGAWKLKQEDVLSEYTWHNGKPYDL
jgi:hypothetical protein